jgi:hypothetical protein
VIFKEQASRRADRFDASGYSWKPGIDYRTHPELYRVGKGEQGVLICEPYKTEILPHWRFRDPETARQSSARIYGLFLDYLAQGDFVGADMARKYLQMGYTRARRYANYRGGRKYEPETGEPLARGTGDPVKAESAEIFYAKWQEAEAHPEYQAWKAAWKRQYG